MTAPLEPSDRYVEYGGRTLREVFVGRNWLAVEDDGGDFPDALERGTSAQVGPWVKLPRSALSRRWSRAVTATWDGARVHVVGVGRGHASIQHFDDQEWAERHHLEGSRYEGYWYGRAPIAELEDVTVTETERPLD